MHMPAIREEDGPTQNSNDVLKPNAKPDSSKYLRKTSNASGRVKARWSSSVNVLTAITLDSPSGTNAGARAAEESKNSDPHKGRKESEEPDDSVVEIPNEKPENAHHVIPTSCATVHHRVRRFASSNAIFAQHNHLADLVKDVINKE